MDFHLEKTYLDYLLIKSSPKHMEKNISRSSSQFAISESKNFKNSIQVKVNNNQSRSLQFAQNVVHIRMHLHSRIMLTEK